MISNGVILFTSLSSEKVDYLQHETNDGIIDIGRKICVDRQMNIIETTNVHVGRSDATISTETDTADKEVSNFTSIVRISKTKGEGKWLITKAAMAVIACALGTFNFSLEHPD